MRIVSNKYIRQYQEGNHFLLSIRRLEAMVDGYRSDMSSIFSSQVETYYLTSVLTDILDKSVRPKPVPFIRHTRFWSLIPTLPELGNCIRSNVIRPYHLKCNWHWDDKLNPTRWELSNHILQNVKVTNYHYIPLTSLRSLEEAKCKESKRSGCLIRWFIPHDLFSISHDYMWYFFHAWFEESSDSDTKLTPRQNQNWSESKWNRWESARICW